MKIAITGKGGVGKTTIAAVLGRILARAGASVVALDADPNPNLAIALGMGVEESARIESAVNVLLERAARSHDDDHGQPGAEELLDDFGVSGPDGVRLVQAGRIERPSGGCLCCGSHRTSRRMFDEIEGEGRVVVADLEAGVNDLMWIMPQASDVVIIVTEAYWKSLEVARRALHVTRELGVTDVVVVANRVQHPADVEHVAAFLPGTRVVTVPDDPAVSHAAASGLSVLDTAPGSPAVEALRSLVDELETIVPPFSAGPWRFRPVPVGPLDLTPQDSLGEPIRG